MSQVPQFECRMNHSIHTSERRSFRGCRRRWDWLFHDRWYPIITAKPLEFGVAYHEAMEVYYRPETWHMPRHAIAALAIKAFVDKCEEQKANFLRLNPDTSLNEEAKADYEERVELGKGMLQWHLGRIAPMCDNFKPVRVEVAFEVPVVNPDTGEQLQCGLCGAPITYGGRIDALVEDEYGDYWIVDWKTTATIREDNDEHLYLDDQIGSYCWAMSVLNIPVRGFMYHEQRKDFPRPPKQNKTTRLGRKFSVSKSEPVEYELYRETVAREDTEAYEAGLYDEYLEWLRTDGPKFHMRYQIHKTPYELREIGKNIYLEAREMVNPDLAIYPAAGRFSCSFCAFRQPCMGKNNGEDYYFTLQSLFTRRDRHYWELKDASTESKGGE